MKELAKRMVQAAERAVIRRTLQQTDGNKALAARLLKISYRAMLYKSKQAGR